MKDTIYFYTPTFKPAGGVVKIFDYVKHALALDYDVEIRCPEIYDENLPLFRIPKFADLKPAKGVKYTTNLMKPVRVSEIVFFSWPKDYLYIERFVRDPHQLKNIIHIIQNVRHANPAFTNGYAIRLLSRPLSRIMINSEVHKAVEKYLNKHSYTKEILLGHNVDYFSKSRKGQSTSGLKIAYTTWKSTVGDRVRAIAEDEGLPYEFKAIRESASWDRIKSLYDWADVFLSTPLAEEGFYLPGLEAMSAGAIVITPNAGGNLAYCNFGENCLEVELDNEQSYLTVLKQISSMNDVEINEMRNAGYSMAKKFSIDRECKEFGDFLQHVSSQINKGVN